MLRGPVREACQPALTVPAFRSPGRIQMLFLTLGLANTTMSTAAPDACCSFPG
jgi:hypothetical protein